jgi:hypothetical protein
MLFQSHSLAMAVSLASLFLVWANMPQYFRWNKLQKWWENPQETESIASLVITVLRGITFISSVRWSPCTSHRIAVVLFWRWVYTDISWYYWVIISIKLTAVISNIFWMLPFPKEVPGNMHTLSYSLHISIHIWVHSEYSSSFSNLFWLKF